MQFESAQRPRMLGFLLALAFACALFVLPVGQALADTGYCSYCSKYTSGTFYYPSEYGCVEPTCTAAGSAIFVCSECGEGNRPQTVPALGHDHQYSHSSATCTADGEDVYVCSRCGDSYGTYAAALGHAYELASSTEATCTENGEETYACWRCGDSYSQVLYALGHDYEVATTEPTCTEAGTEASTCSRCGDKQTKAIAALGHDMKESNAIAATCTDAGLRTLTCQRCGVVEEQKASPLGHKWPETWTVETKPTTFAEGKEYRLCERCGERDERAIAKLPLTETPEGLGLIAFGLLVLGGIGFGVRKLMAGHAAAAAAASAASGFELIQLSEKRIFAKLGPDPSNEEFLELLKSRSHLSLVQYDPAKGTSLSEQISDAGPDAVVMDFAGAEGATAALETIRDLYAKHEKVKFEAIAFDADRAVETQLAIEQEAGTLFAFAEADQNKYVKMSRLIVPLYQDVVKDTDSLENIGVIADLFGIPAVSTMLNAVADAKRAGKVAKTATKAFEGADLEFSDGVSVVGNIARFMGLDAIKAVTSLIQDASDVKEYVDGDEKGDARTAQKTKDVASDAGKVIKHLIK